MTAAIAVSACLVTTVSCGEPRPKTSHYPAAQVPAAGPGTREGASGMPLQLTVNRPEVVVGEALEVVVKLVNTGGGTIEAPSPNSTSTFEYIFRSAKDGPALYALSSRFALAARYDDTLPTEPVEMVTLNPGEAVTYEVDISDYAVEPIRPGRYLVSAAYGSRGGRMESPGALLTIVPLRARALAVAAGSNDESLGFTLGHGGANGGLVVFQREIRPRLRGDGVLYRRIEILGSAAAPASVASAAGLEASGGVRWYAWLQGEALGAGIAQNKTEFVRVNPVPLGLRSPMLQGHGWQLERETGVFTVLGRDAQGRVAVAVATFQANGSGTVKSVPLAMQRMPVQWAVRHRPQDGRYDVVAATSRDGAVRVERQTVSLAAGTADQPATLVERAEPLAALGLHPLAGDGADAVDLLFGPLGDEGQMTFLRLSLIDGRSIAMWTFKAPDDPGKRRPTAWAIAPRPMPEPIVLAKHGDKLLVRRVAGGQGWAPVIEGAAQAEHLRLAATSDRTMYAIWVDPLDGLGLKAVPLP